MKTNVAVCTQLQLLKPLGNVELNDNFKEQYEVIRGLFGAVMEGNIILEMTMQDIVFPEGWFNLTVRCL